MRLPRPIAFPLSVRRCWRRDEMMPCWQGADLGRLMPLADFVHLRVHTAYSLSAGAIRIKELAALCRARQMPAVAITDAGNLFGALEFATACTDAGVQPIIGCEIALASAEEIRPGRAPELDRLVLLVQSEAGYRN